MCRWGAQWWSSRRAQTPYGAPPLPAVCDALQLRAKTLMPPTVTATQVCHVDVVGRRRRPGRPCSQNWWGKETITPPDLFILIGRFSWVFLSSLRMSVIFTNQETEKDPSMKISPYHTWRPRGIWIQPHAFPHSHGRFDTSDEYVLLHHIM